MLKRRRNGGTRLGAWASAIACLLLFVVSAAVAFPPSFLKVAPFRLGLDLQGGAHLVYEADMSQIPEADRGDALEGVRDVIERRVNAFGVSEPLVATTISDGHYRIVIELAGILDVNEAIKQIGETPILEFKEENPDYTGALTLEQQTMLQEANITEKVAADAVLKLALEGQDFNTLIDQYTLVEDEKLIHGDVRGITGASLYSEAVADIEAQGIADGTVLPEVYSTANGYEVLKLVDRDSSQNEMQLSHILICYQGRTNCSSDRDPLTAEDLAKQLLAQATPINFGQLAAENSDDPGSKDNNGDLGFVKPGTTVDEFDQAAQALAVGEISKELVETDFGFHIIYKRGERPYTTYHFQRVILKRTKEADIAPLAMWKNTGLSGKELQSSRVEFDPNTNAPLVSLNFNADGAKLFEELTAVNAGKSIAIILDGEVISAPVVQQKISGGQAIISGNFTLEEAKLLSQRLNAGALPVPVTLVSQQTVGPTLGAESLQKSITAALIGFALVALFMIAYYRLLGLVAVFALLGYAAINLMLYKALGVTMSLSGIAGFILSVGMAVDANVLIFERLKEELKSGRDLGSAISEGFSRAWPSIRDGNLTTLIAAGILFWFSTSFIKGFALTLSIGVLVSMFSAIVATRAYLNVLEGFRFIRNSSWLLGVKRPK